MEDIRIGLIGAGWVAREHLKVIKDIDSLEAVGITSRTLSKAEDVAREYNIAVCADSVDALIEETLPDALMVLVSEDQVAGVAEAVIPCGLPLFIEKPAGLTPADNLRLAELAREYKTPTMVGFNRRYYSIFHKGLEVIRAHGPLLGLVVEGHERMWRIREGKKFSEDTIREWIFANSTHTIDLLRFFGGEPQRLSSIAHRYKEPRGDQFAAIMEFESGAIGQYNAHWYSPGGWRVVLYGDGVTVEFKPLENGRWTDKNFKTDDIQPDEVDVKYKPGFFRQMEAFGKLARTRTLERPALDCQGAYQTMRLAQQIARDCSSTSGCFLPSP